MGSENIIHNLRAVSQSHPEKDIFLIDAQNAFNSASRFHGLQQVALHFPYLLPFLSRIYAFDSKGWVYGHDSTHHVDSKQGYHQGDVLGSWLFCLTIQPLLTTLQSYIGEDDFLQFFIDDGNVAADHDNMIEFITNILHHGPQYGYNVNTSKSTYLIGKCDSRETAELRFQKIVELGLDPEIIKFHPDNDGPPEEYGGKVLGSYIGSDEFCKARLSEKIDEFRHSAKSITTVHNKQTQFLLLKMCFSPKITYLQRTMPPYLLSDFQTEFNNLKFSILANIIDCSLPDLSPTTKFISQLRLCDGGLGLTFLNDTAISAYISSCIQNLPQHTLESSNIPLATAYRSSLSLLNSLSHKQLNYALLSKQKADSDYCKQSKTLQYIINQYLHPHNKNSAPDLLRDSPTHLAWLISCSSSESGQWLNVVPKSDLHSIGNEAFSSALRMRLFLPQKCILPNTKCNCTTVHSGQRQNRFVDPQGMHWSSGCNYDGVRILTHDNVRDCIKRILGVCGVTTKLEENYVMQVPQDPDSKKRPDITAFNLPNYGRPILLDVMISCPVPS